MDYTNASGIDPYARVSSQSGPLQGFTPDMQIAEWQNRDTARALYQQAIEQGNIANQQANVNLGKSQYDLAQAGRNDVLNQYQFQNQGLPLAQNQDYQGYLRNAQILGAQGKQQEATIANQNAGNQYLGQLLSSAKLPVSDEDISKMKPADQQAFMSQQAQKYMDVVRQAQAQGINVGNVPNNPADFQNWVQGIQNWYQTSPEFRGKQLQAQTQLGVAEKNTTSREEVANIYADAKLQAIQDRLKYEELMKQNYPKTLDEALLRGQITFDQYKQYQAARPQFNPLLQGEIAGNRTQQQQQAENQALLQKLKYLGVPLTPQQEQFLSGSGMQQQAPQQSTGPKVGDVQNGYRYKGGDPANQNSWEKMK